MAGIGLPTIIIGPGRNAQEHLFLFGPNTVGASTSNDFNISVVDDPESQAALLQSIDPATLGFFINQGYDRRLVFFLFISKMVDVDKNTKEVVHTYSNEPYGYLEPSDHCPQYGYGLNCHWEEFYLKLDRLVKQYGLSVEVDPTFVPARATVGRALFCFSPDAPTQLSFVERCRPALVSEKAPVTNRSQKLTGAIKSLRTKRGGMGHNSFTFEGNVTPPEKDRKAEPAYSFTNPDRPSVDVHIYTRSVYGAYRFLGELLNLQEDPELKGEFLAILRSDDLFFRPLPETEPTRMLNVTHAGMDCWTNIEYDSTQCLVPKGALGTKRTFQILHQLFRLFAAPSNQPVTPTVRAVQ